MTNPPENDQNTHDGVNSLSCYKVPGKDVILFLRQ